MQTVVLHRLLENLDLFKYFLGVLGKLLLKLK
jgi:hypothetical protein